MAMKNTMGDYFWMSQRTWKSAGLSICLFSVLSTMYYHARTTKKRKIRMGEVAYRDRYFKHAL